MALRYAILGLLNYQDMTGYDLKKLFDDSIKNFWFASISQIYRELNTLQSEGYLISVIQPQSDKPDKRIYSITTAGKTAFKKWIAHFPDKLSKEKRDEFCLRLFFGSNLSKAELIKQFKRLVREKVKQREEIKSYIKMTQLYAQKLELIGGEELYWTFILRRALMNIETTIKWATECIADLNEAKNV